jgi:hypothetical protein
MLWALELLLGDPREGNETGNTVEESDPRATVIVGPSFWLKLSSKILHTCSKNKQYFLNLKV